MSLRHSHTPEGCEPTHEGGANLSDGHLAHQDLHGSHDASYHGMWTDADRAKYASARKAASVASSKANRSGNKEDHHQASIAHWKAATIVRAQGGHTGAHHDQKSAEHEKKWGGHPETAQSRSNMKKIGRTAGRIGW